MNLPAIGRASSKILCLGHTHFCTYFILACYQFTLLTAAKNNVLPSIISPEQSIYLHGLIELYFDSIVDNPKCHCTDKAIAIADNRPLAVGGVSLTAAYACITHWRCVNGEFVHNSCMTLVFLA